MNFEKLNNLNVVANILSGNLLPVTPNETNFSITWKIYSVGVWIMHIIYLTTSIIGFFYAPKEKVLQNSSLNTVVCVEIILLIVHLHNRKKLLRRLIEKLNGVLALDNETLRNVVIKTVKPLERPLKIYMIGIVGSVVTWAAMSLLKIFKKKEFVYEDYPVPAVFSKEPFSIGVFLFGVVIQMFGSAATIIKKTSLDIYTVYLILLMTSQYRYLTIRLGEIFQNDNSKFRDECSKSFKRGSMFCEKNCCENERWVTMELNALTRHHMIIAQMAVLIRKLLSMNVCVIYVDSVFRFCFLGFMFIMSPAVGFEKALIVVYMMSALTQLYILCFCVQQLFESSQKLTDDAIHEKWYTYNLTLQHTFLQMILANKLKCRLSNVQQIDLTLPSFMAILNQAYSFFLFFLRAKGK